jgi:hypothetical protein
MSFDAFLDNMRSSSTTDPDRPKLTGGRTGENPNVVQSKAGINTLTVTLPGAPTAGNLLVAIGTHWNNGAGAINGYTMHTMINGVTNAGIMVATKFAGASESATQNPFSVGAASNMIAVFEVSGAQAVTEVNYIKEVATNPATVTGIASETDLIVGMFAQQVANDPFSLSGDTSTAIENITGTSGADSPHRLQTFSYDPSSYALSETATLTAGSSARMAALLVAVSSQPFNRGRLVIGRFASSVAMAPRKPVGNFYFEAECKTLAGTPGVGICDTGYGHAWQALGQGTLNVVYNSNGQVRFNNTTLATIAAWAAGDRIGVAVDVPNELIWFRVNNGSWNNDGTANPVTGVNGISFAAMTGLAIVPALSFSVIGTTFDTNFYAADFVDTAPTGFNSAADVVVNFAIQASDPTSPQRGISTTMENDDIIYMVPDLAYGLRPTVPAGPVKVLAGEVRENDIGVEGRLVRVYNKATGDLIGEFRTAPDGSFIIPVQDGAAPHYVVAFDDEAGDDYNAKIYDNVLPG